MVVNGYEIEPYAYLLGADLSKADLYGADLSNTALYGADLSKADLREADLRYANLSGADLSKADLREADLRYANLYGADLREADLSKANLSEANLSKANLSEANLSGADLSKADLYGADLREADLYGAIINWPFRCPLDGSFIGWKKASGCVVKLLIPEDAKRLSGTTNKCRCNKAEVLDIFDNTNTSVPSVSSDHDRNFIYEKGKVVTVDNFDENRWNTCSTGIHFFITREEAANYRL